ncbi:MAG: ABC transporter permease [Blastocatellia bacterium]
MRTLWQDIRYGARMLRKQPGYTLIAVLALALGIGLNSAIFSLVNAILLKPLPFEQLDRMVVLWENQPSRGVDYNEASAANYLDWRDQSQSFENLAIYTWSGANLNSVDPPERVRGFRVSANLFDVTGVRPFMGRAFTPAEQQPGQDNVVILTHGLWQRRFGADPQIVGKEITVSNVARTVVGVLPREAVYPRGGEILMPYSMTPAQQANRGGHGSLTVGRLKSGVTLEQARADVDAIARRLAERYPDTNAGRGVTMIPLLEETVRRFRAATLVMLGAVGFVLLIACANVANLTLARAAGRGREIAVRQALGAARARIIRQLLTESMLLAALGGALGVTLAVWGVDALKVALPDDAPLLMPGYEQLGINPRVVIFTTLVSLLTGILSGLVPAWQATRTSLNETLKEGGGRSGAAAGGNRARGALVVAEIALSLVLLVGAGLLMRNFLGLLQSNPGFDPDNVLTMGVSLPAAKYREPARRAAFFQELTQRLAVAPGVESAAAINYLPLGQSNSSSSFYVEGEPEPAPGQAPNGRYRLITPQYFQTMGIRLLHGRVFTTQEQAASAPVVIINETMARRHWPTGSALGKRMRVSGPIAESPWREIVGIVSDVRHEMNLPVEADYFLPHAQDPWATMMLTVKTHTDPLALAGPIQRIIQETEPGQPVFDVRTMTQVRDRSIMHFRMMGVLMGIFGALALVLAATGIYGVMSYMVSQRRHEIGVRMALGARARDVMALIMRQGMRMTLTGAGLGLLGALGLARALSGVLEGVAVNSWTTFVIIPMVLILVAIAACAIPAWRATRTDPLEALRYE